ncbi:hypothetical protein B2J93_6634 [Marssonina coronariae]|uniref:AB hydrolase-1 domain-containing protein n=1 Tax=Diplocarpon coronariae TaxID=2795749 RepID=A0A218Z3N4_9HELO|nr:hypothetical protein JHW43_000143 [Diplocarpon mali]OWP02669.1 hypothetical protein B2J93_6634 [Marssonina coronariae]
MLLLKLLPIVGFTAMSLASPVRDTRSPDETSLSFATPEIKTQEPAPAETSATEFRQKLPLLVIVPGAWQLPQAWYDFLEVLRKADIEYLYVPNESVGTKPTVGLAGDTKNLQATLGRLVKEGRECILLGHSYGGLVISSATEGFDIKSVRKRGEKGGVVMTVFMAAFVVPENESLLKFLGGEPAPWMLIEENAYVVGDKSKLADVAFNDIQDEKVVEKYSEFMARSSLLAFTEPNTYAPWDHGVPAAYIRTTDDNAVPLEVQNGMFRYLDERTDAFIFQIFAGHCPWISQPEDVRMTLEDILGLASLHSVTVKADGSDE